MSEHSLVTISTRTIIKVIAVVLLLWLLYVIRDILILFFVAIILASLIEPWANWCAGKRIPRSFSVLAIYVVLVGLFSAVVVLLVPTILNESQNLVKSLTSYWEDVTGGVGNIGQFARDFDILSKIQEYILPTGDAVGKTIGNIVATVSGVFGGLFSLMLVLVLAFYLVVEEDSAWRWVRIAVPDHYQPFVSGVLIKIRKKLGQWLRAQLLLSLFVAVLVYVGLLALGVQYALVISVVAGVLELVPYVGPVLSAVPAIFLAFAQTGDFALPLAVAVLFGVVQLVENNILVPRVMQKAVGINPVISILSILIGARIAGIAGVLLAIPVVLVVSTFIEEVRSSHEHDEKIP